LASPDVAPRLRAIVERYEPLVVDALGSRWPKAYEIEVAQLGGMVVGQANDKTKHVKLSPLAVEDEEQAAVTLVHELVHVPANGHWTELPYGIQEGLAFWLSLALVTGPSVYGGPEPAPEALWRALTIGRDEYQALDVESRRAVDQAATWLASHLVEVQP
jgi:hypothetical protein